MDLVIFTSQLAAGLGPLGTIGLFANYGITAWILRKATPSFGRMAATEARMEGEYRAGLARIGRDGEEIAYASACVQTFFSFDSFYDGGRREKAILWSAYERLASHVHAVFKVRSILF